MTKPSSLPVVMDYLETGIRIARQIDVVQRVWNKKLTMSKEELEATLGEACKGIVSLDIQVSRHYIAVETEPLKLLVEDAYPLTKVTKDLREFLRDILSNYDPVVEDPGFSKLLNKLEDSEEDDELCGICNRPVSEH